MNIIKRTTEPTTNWVVNKRNEERERERERESNWIIETVTLAQVKAEEVLTKQNWMVAMRRRHLIQIFLICPCFCHIFVLGKCPLLNLPPLQEDLHLVHYCMENIHYYYSIFDLHVKFVQNFHHMDSQTLHR